MLSNQVFGKLELNSVRYSEYDVYEKDGAEWIAPSPTAEVLVNNQLEKPERLLLDALNTGRVLYMSEYADDFKREILLSFIRCYGLLTKDNAERLKWVGDLLAEIFTHFVGCKAPEKTDDPAVREHYAKLVSRYQLRDLAIGLEMPSTPDEDGFCNPVMVWYFNSLRQAIETTYIIALTNPDINLRMCKHCGAAFIADHGRSVFCSDRCRNQYNVYKHRANKKDAEFEK